VVQAITIALIPVAVGKAIRRRSADLAARADRPVRILSIVVLAIVSVGALPGERENLADYMQQVGLVTGVLHLTSLTLGYAGPRLLRLGKPQATASSMEVGTTPRPWH